MWLFFVHMSLSFYFLLAGMDSSKLCGAISPIWPYSLRNLSPFSVVLKICSEELKSSRPLIVRTLRYSFSWAYDRNALYIILVFVAPPLAASRICDIMSVLLLYRTSLLWQCRLLKIRQITSNKYHKSISVATCFTGNRLERRSEVRSHSNVAVIPLFSWAAFEGLWYRRLIWYFNLSNLSSLPSLMAPLKCSDACICSR